MVKRVASITIRVESMASCCVEARASLVKRVDSVEMRVESVVMTGQWLCGGLWRVE